MKVPVSLTRELPDGTMWDAAAACEEAAPGKYAGLPYSLRVLVENLARTESSAQERARLIAALAARSRATDFPFRPARVVLQDLLGTPALVDLAAMRDAVAAAGGDPRRINPVLPAHLVVDHSVIVDRWAEPGAEGRNRALEGARNAERFEFLAWAGRAFSNLSVIPSGHGILHQINLERLSPVVARTVPNGRPIVFPDSLVGTDSHTTMINALGVLGWGVGGIEAEAAMLGEAVTMRLPEIVGIRLGGDLAPGALATDVVLALTEWLRQRDLAGALVEFGGPSAGRLGVADRATIANMAPEFGATAALFAPDARTLDYLKLTGRTGEVRARVERYARAQGLWADDLAKAEYDRTMEFDLGSVRRAIAGPRQPHQRLELGRLPLPCRAGAPQMAGLPDGAVVIAAITACTNTSNPRAMVAAGLLARNACRRGLAPARWTKTSFAPGSRVVADYLARSGLSAPLDRLGFQVVGFGCTTCNGMSGPLDAEVAAAIDRSGVSTAAVLSGNRNFDGRIHPQAREAYIMSPPLVVAYAIAGHVRFDPGAEPLAHDASGRPVFLADLWPSDAEIEAVAESAVTADLFEAAYAGMGDAYSGPAGSADGVPPRYPWREASAYIRRPPYWDDGYGPTDPVAGFRGLRPLAMLGDHISTDHISPSGAIAAESAAGRYLRSLGVPPAEFNSYGTRRGNHEVGMRATFANPRLKNEMAGGAEGPLTRLMPEGEVMGIFEAAEAYRKRRQPLAVIAGREYGSGSSRDWAAKGPRLLGVNLVLAESFERIHRANLAGVGILPVQFAEGTGRRSLGLDGGETFDLEGVESLRENAELTLVVRRRSGAVERSRARCRLETRREVEYFRSGGLLRHLAAKEAGRLS